MYDYQLAISCQCSNDWRFESIFGFQVSRTQALGAFSSLEGSLSQSFHDCLEEGQTLQDGHAESAQFSAAAVTWALHRTFTECLASGAVSEIERGKVF